MKIAFIGGVIFSHEILSHILNNGWDISVIFSYDESKNFFYSDMKSFNDISKKYGIPNIKVMNINDPENITILQKYNPDLILVMGWSQLLKNDILKIPKLGVIGSHPTELPKYPGRAPISWSILKGLKESALTFFYIEKGIDNGDILDQRKFKITDEDNATTIYKKIISLGKIMLLENLLLLKNGQAKRTKQDEKKFLENWPKRTVDDGKVNWFDTALEIHTLVRATTHPYPGAFTTYNDTKLIIWESDYIPNEKHVPGKILKINFNNIYVGTIDGILIIKKIGTDLKLKCILSEIFSDTDVGKFLGK